jgi:protein-disulfide isomerase
MWSKETKFFTGLTVLLFLIFGLWWIIYTPPKAENPEDYEKDRPQRGNPQASVVVRVYFDFYCSHCKEVEVSLNQVLQNYGDKIKVEYRYAPINEASFVVDAAAECAQKQDKFFPYHDLLFAGQGQTLTLEKLNTFAVQVGLDTAKFSQCLESQETLPIVNYDLKQAVRAGVTGTPTIFVNGQLIDWRNLESSVARTLR